MSCLSVHAQYYKNGGLFELYYCQSLKNELSHMKNVDQLLIDILGFWGFGVLGFWG